MLCPPLPPLFPYTTLFRSQLPGGIFIKKNHAIHGLELQGQPRPSLLVQYGPRRTLQSLHAIVGIQRQDQHIAQRPCPLEQSNVRSEEHTSELQSRENLVCR